MGRHPGSALGLGRWQAGQAEARAGHRAAQHTKGKASTPSPHLSYLPIHIWHGNDNGMAAWQGGQRLSGSASAGAGPGGGGGRPTEVRGQLRAPAIRRNVLRHARVRLLLGLFRFLGPALAGGTMGARRRFQG